MAGERWVEVARQWCEIAQHEAVIMERRVFPAEMMPDTEPFRVLGRRCTADIYCNLSGCACRWAYTEPVVDRFALQS